MTDNQNQNQSLVVQDNQKLQTQLVQAQQLIEAQQNHLLHLQKIHHTIAADVFFSIERLRGFKALAQEVEDAKLAPTIRKWNDVIRKNEDIPLTVAQMTLIFQYGCELKLTPMISLMFIDIIHNRPCLKAQAMLALARSTGEMTQFYYESTDEWCTVFIQRKGQALQPVVFTMEDAVAQDLLKKPNWKSQPTNMLIWRAVAKAVRLFFGDAIGGLYTADELGSEDIVYDYLPEQEKPTNVTAIKTTNTTTTIASSQLHLVNQNQNQQPEQSEKQKVIDRVLKLKLSIYKLGLEIEEKNLDTMEIDELKTYGNTLLAIKNKHIAKIAEEAKLDAESSEPTTINKDNVIDIKPEVESKEEAISATNTSS